MIHQTAEVLLWGTHIATVAWDDQRSLASLRYVEKFSRSGIEVSPFSMPLSENEIFTFPELQRSTFKGLPGFLADSLPDKFGKTLLDQWIQREGHHPNHYSPVDRLCFVGTRGMGALEFRPHLSSTPDAAEKIDMEHLVELANMALSERGLLQTSLDDSRAAEQIIRIGSSAGGARAKALVLWNPETNDIMSGQLPPKNDFQFWLIKFDGISNSGDKEGADPQGYGAIEYAYHLMALEAGVQMSPCRLFEENGRRHFMTQRFDRVPAKNDEASGQKLHMQSLCALKHYDFNMAGAYSYEQALRCCYDLRLGKEAIREMYRRMCFNVIARNQDDHTKNIAFLMDKSGGWSLSPAFDVTYSYNPQGEWTARHQMTINGKRDDIERADLLTVAKQFRIARPQIIIEQIIEAVQQWPVLAKNVGIDTATSKNIQNTFRLF